MTGKPTNTTAMDLDLIEDCAQRCEELAGKLRAVAVIMRAKKASEIYLFKSHYRPFEEMRLFIASLERSRARLVEGNPLGPDSVTDRSVLKKPKKK